MVLFYYWTTTCSSPKLYSRNIQYKSNFNNPWNFISLKISSPSNGSYSYMSHWATGVQGDQVLDNTTSVKIMYYPWIRSLLLAAWLASCIATKSTVINFVCVCVCARTRVHMCVHVCVQQNLIFPYSYSFRFHETRQ